jgi:hypothetical protein
VDADKDSGRQPVPDEAAPPTETASRRRWEPQPATFRVYETALPDRPPVRSNGVGGQPGIARDNPALGKFWSLETTGVGDVIPFTSTPIPSPLFATRSRAEEAA